MTLSSSKTLAFVFLPSFPVNKFPRAVRANWPGSPKSGRDKAVPRLPCSVGAPRGRRFPHLPGCHGPGPSWACTKPDSHGSARWPSAARPLWPRRPGRSPPPGPGPARSGLRAPPPRPRHHPRAGPEAPGLQAARRASPRLPQRPRLLLQLLPRLAHGARHQDSRGRGVWAASAACEELRPERAPPSRQSVTSSPLCPPSAAGSAPRPAPPRPPGSAHPAGRSREGGRQGRHESRGVRCPCGLRYGGPVVTGFVVLTTVCRMRISRSDLLLLWFYCHCHFVIVVIVIFISSFTLMEPTA